MQVDLTRALKERYKIRATGPGNKYYEVSVPHQVVEREAELAGLTPTEFCEQYVLEALYDHFEGIHYRFMKK